MESLQAREHEVYAFGLEDLFFADGSIWAQTHHLQLAQGATPWYTIALPLRQVYAVWMRKDPPVDAAYVRQCNF